jgi:hypothetical protein
MVIQMRNKGVENMELCIDESLKYAKLIQKQKQASGKHIEDLVDEVGINKLKEIMQQADDASDEMKAMLDILNNINRLHSKTSKLKKLLQAYL